MQFESPLKEAILLKRYKRFLADFRLDDGTTITVHCPNTGSMKNCQEPGSRVWYTTSSKPGRKYPCTWQLVEVEPRSLVGINTGLSNALVQEAIGAGVISQLQQFESIRTEVAYGSQNSRIDFLLEPAAGSGAKCCYVEVKNVSLGQEDGLGLFPDAVTARGQKHLQELMEVAASDSRAVLLFCVQHTGIDRVMPADAIDPEYGRLLREAQERGVELLAYGADIDPAASSVSLQRQLPVLL